MQQWQCTSPFYWGLTKPGWYMWKCWTGLCTIHLPCSCIWCRQEDTREDRGSDFSGVLHDACSSSIEGGKPVTVSGVDKDSQAEILSGATTFKFPTVFYALLHSIGSSLELRSPATASLYNVRKWAIFTRFPFLFGSTRPLFLFGRGSEFEARWHGIGAGTGPAGPAMAGPFSAEIET